MKKIITLFAIVMACVSCGNTGRSSQRFIIQSGANYENNQEVISYTPKIEAEVALPDGTIAPVNFTTVTGFSIKNTERKRAANYPHLVVELIELLAIIFLILRGRGPSDERIKDVTSNSQRLVDKFVLKSEYYTLKTSITELSRKVSELQKQLEELSKQEGNKSKRGEYYSNSSSESHGLTQTGQLHDSGQKRDDSGTAEQGLSTPMQYAKNFKDGFMNQCSPDVAQFRLSIKGDGVSFFEFCGDFETAKANVDGTFDGVCKIEGGLDGSSRITTVSAGEASLQSNGKWKVIKPATIKFE